MSIVCIDDYFDILLFLILFKTIMTIINILIITYLFKLILIIKILCNLFE